MEKGEVWIYFDKDANKNRPAIIVGNSLFSTEQDVVVAKLTSYGARNEFDVDLPDWERYGLREHSTVRCSKLFTLKEHELKFFVAYVDDLKMEEIKNKIAKYILF